MKPKGLKVPKPFHHKAAGQDAVVIRDENNRRRMVYLGKHGSAEAANRYRELLGEHFAGVPVLGVRDARSRADTSPWPTVAQLCASYLLHAERFYRDTEGRPTGEVTHATIAFRKLLDLHRDMPTDRMTIRDLLSVRDALVDYRGVQAHGRRAPSGLSRRTINDRMARIKRLFRWGVEQGLVPGAAWHELSALRGLPKGRSGVHDNPAVEAVPWSLVEATLPHLVPTFADLVRLQWWSGVRPAEALSLTRRQLDTTGETWFYRVAKHKGSWRGRERVVALGPKAREILRPRLRLELDAPMFSGADAWRERRALTRASRATPPTAQMHERDVRGDQHAQEVAAVLTVDEYRRAIHRACDAADLPRWSPHRLRHAAGTRIAREVGIEAARAALGHSDLSTTRRYAQGADVAIAADAAARLG